MYLFLLIRLSLLSVTTPAHLLYVFLSICLSVMLLRCPPPPASVSTYFFPPNLQSVCKSVFYDAHSSVCTYFFQPTLQSVCKSVFYDAHSSVCTYFFHLSCSLSVSQSSTMLTRPFVRISSIFLAVCLLRCQRPIVFLNVFLPTRLAVCLSICLLQCAPFHLYLISSVASLCLLPISYCL